jgi:hypothetical protein
MCLASGVTLLLTNENYTTTDVATSDGDWRLQRWFGAVRADDGPALENWGRSGATSKKDQPISSPLFHGAHPIPMGTIWKADRFRFPMLGSDRSPANRSQYS